jgi:hypothetical protein
VFGENNIVSDTWQLIAASKEQKEKCIGLLQKFWYQQFEVALPIEDKSCV